MNILCNMALGLVCRSSRTYKWHQQRQGLVKFLSYTTQDVDEINREFQLIFGGGSDIQSGHRPQFDVSAPPTTTTANFPAPSIERADHNPALQATRKFSVEDEFQGIVSSEHLKLLVPGYYGNFVGTLCTGQTTFQKILTFGVDGLGRWRWNKLAEHQSNLPESQERFVLHAILENSFVLSSGPLLSQRLNPKLFNQVVLGDFGFHDVVDTIDEAVCSPPTTSADISLVRKQGVVSFGDSLEDAWEKVIRFERLAAIQLRLFR
eukprot:TRINITY_DN1829_c0_g1_i4.p1 TRINITY_DN1829_c0_g1~~TRINITY_DN1829_c0_g1_i4.p1  ORF type:complete len:263 (+),score=62.76 TRINITY_DN1829_c0_g1_i4:552-1340(+)